MLWVWYGITLKDPGAVRSLVFITAKSQAWNFGGSYPRVLDNHFIRIKITLGITFLDFGEPA